MIHSRRVILGSSGDVCELHRYDRPPEGDPQIPKGHSGCSGRNHGMESPGHIEGGEFRQAVGSYRIVLLAGCSGI